MHGIIYAWPIYDVDPLTGLLLPPDPVTGRRPVRLDYGGQTIRALQTRAGEHLEGKPWADIVVGDKPIVIEQGLWTKAERDAREIAAIKRIRPRYNYEHNLDNPERIPIYDPRTGRYVQLDQRHVRDRAAGREPWQPPGRRPEPVAGPEELGYVLPALGAACCATGRFLLRLPRRVQLALLTPVVWIVCAWALSAWLVTAGWPIQLSRAAAAAVSAVLLAGALRTRAIRRWARRRRR